MTEQPRVDELDEVDRRYQQARPERSLWTLLSILLLLIVVVLALLLFRGCGTNRGLIDRGVKTITSVEGAEPIDGVISVWLEESVGLSEVLNRAGVAAESTVELGGGRYLIIISAGLEQSTAQKIAPQQGVNDVGRVYQAE